MKYFLFIMSVYTSMAFASGKLTLEPGYDAIQDKSHITMGLGIYEIIGDGIAYNSWTGFGDSFDVDTNYRDWYSTKHQVDFTDKNGLTFSPGIRVSYLDHDYDVVTPKELVSEVFAKVGVTLW
jgi:hypothetical protein